MSRDTASSDKHANRLIHETSPYLLQHAHNPVDWYPWGEEAFARAREENKPVFLSIGYAACHWCHVMERESFENEGIADYLNRHFVSIKVDREERPDLDDLYMQSVLMMTGSGGWPMTVFLTPEGKPFFGGTYFPPQDMYGRPGFGSLIQQIQAVYETNPGKVREMTSQLSQAIIEQDLTAEGAELSPDLLERAASELKRRFDRVYGGFGGAPKFPPSTAINILLRRHAQSGDPDLLEMIELTLGKMARGGMYDQLGGGFHRYSTDHLWLVPHFEKMLYDNALLAPVYLDAWLVTGNDDYLRIARETLDYTLREMTDPRGGFYSTQDADSEGVEGKYYIWRPQEVEQVLGEEDAALFNEFYDVSADGNWHEGDGASILNVRVPLADFAKLKGEDPDELRRRLDDMRTRLLAVRDRRVPPLKDDKVITEWNGMMISAMARAAQVTGDARYREAAEQAAGFVLNTLRAEDGGLLRTWRATRDKPQGEARINGFVADYAFVIGALVDLYETTFEPRRLDQARQLADIMLERFHDEGAGGFYTHDGRDPTVFARIKEFYDGATPSGNSAAVHALRRLGRHLDRTDYRTAVERTLKLTADSMRRRPGAHEHLIAALADELAGTIEVAVIADPHSGETAEVLRALRSRYLPGRIVAAGDGDHGEGVEIALLRGRTAIGDRPAIYVCRDYVCERPVHSADEMLRQIDRLKEETPAP